ncbi:uncharacterized protein V6R79_006266 [Siganus canaliculatus]
MAGARTGEGYPCPSITELTVTGALQDLLKLIRKKNWLLGKSMQTNTSTYCTDQTSGAAKDCPSVRASLSQPDGGIFPHRVAAKFPAGISPLIAGEALPLRWDVVSVREPLRQMREYTERRAFYWNNEEQHTPPPARTPRRYSVRQRGRKCRDSGTTATPHGGVREQQSGDIKSVN